MVSVEYNSTFAHCHLNNGKDKIIIRSTQILEITKNTYNKMKISDMKYDKAFINRNFRIKVYGTLDGKRINTLVGVSGLIDLIGFELFNYFIYRALKQR